MPRAIASASSAKVSTRSPLCPITSAVPVSWQDGSTRPAAMFAFLSSSSATKRSFSDASGSSRIFASCARWPGRSRKETSSKAAAATRESSSGSTRRNPWPASSTGSIPSRPSARQGVSSAPSSKSGWWRKPVISINPRGDGSMRPMRGPIGALAPALAAVLLLLAGAARAQEAARAVVAAGKRVSIAYTLRLEVGTVVETASREAPFTYLHGDGQLLPGLERALEGMAVGERKQGTLSAADAFGEVDAALFVEVEAARIPEADRRAGAWLDYKDPHGERQRVRVHEVRGDQVVVDMNHPYAGSGVRYEVEVVKIE